VTRRRIWPFGGSDDLGGIGMTALRGGLLVIGVVLGGLIIANTGPPGGGHHHASGRGGLVPIPHPSASAEPCGKPTGIRAAVENATSVKGLAAATAAKLKSAGYSINAQTDVGNAPSQSRATTVFFRGADNQQAALCLKKRFFPVATVKLLPASAGLSGLVQVAVYLGSNYAASHPVS
jgi:LytR cell envelope-related transcriptional attenuator